MEAKALRTQALSTQPSSTQPSGADAPGRHHPDRRVEHGAPEASSRLILRKTEAPRQLRRPSAAPAPIVKWAGGKGKLADALLARWPRRFNCYFEPFFGGGAMYFRITPGAAVLSDRNEALMSMYRCVAWHVEGVIRRLRVHRDSHDRDYYYRLRERWNAGDLRSEVERAAAFIYLNKTCYNGLYRVNAKGHFNVPMGRYASPRIFDADHLRAVSSLLQRADLRAGHYADAVTDARAGDFVYFDPPYHPLTPTSSFTSYTAASFGVDDQRELAQVARDLVDRGVHVVVSNSDTSFVRKLYRGFSIDTIRAARAINSRADRRQGVDELIISSPA